MALSPKNQEYIERVTALRALLTKAEADLDFMVGVLTDEGSQTDPPYVGGVVATRSLLAWCNLETATRGFRALYDETKSPEEKAYEANKSK